MPSSSPTAPATVGRRPPRLPRAASSRRCPRAASPCATAAIPRPQVSRTLERLRQFLTLVGLTALLVGGVGVANAVATYIDRRRKVIAAFKSLGATSAYVLWIHLLQVMMIAGIGIVLGIGLGFLIPVALTACVGDAAADQGRPHRQRPQPADRAGLRLAGVAAVHAVAARAGRAGARRRAVPRRGGAGAQSGRAGASSSLTLAAGPAAGGARRAHLRGAAARALLLPRRGRRVRGVPGPRQRHRLGARGAAAAAPAGAGARHRQPRRARRADALGGAVARAPACRCW